MGGKLSLVTRSLPARPIMWVRTLSSRTAHRLYSTHATASYRGVGAARGLVRWPVCRLRGNFGNWSFATFSSFLFERKCNETHLLEHLFSDKLGLGLELCSWCGLLRLPYARDRPTGLYRVGILATRLRTQTFPRSEVCANPASSLGVFVLVAGLQPNGKAVPRMVVRGKFSIRTVLLRSTRLLTQTFPRSEVCQPRKHPRCFRAGGRSAA
eukprot:scaffold56980_cov97-Phaeocystis_antarctica.AAC.2